MRTLVIDTATRACSVALFDVDRVIASHHEIIGRGHAERLLPLIADLPDRGRAERICVNVGPGSFTGIRVGVAAARALGLAWKAPVAGYGCLTLVAAMARAAQAGPGSIDVVMTGGHGEYYFQHFDRDGAAGTEATSLSPAIVQGKLKGDAVAGDGAVDFDRGQIIDLLPNAACWHLISELTPLPPRPIYGRAPDATLPKVAAL